MLVPLMAAASAGDQITLDTVGSAVMWEKITNGVGSFISGVVTPVINVCSNSEICLAFLACTFVGIGVRNVRRLIGAFGRGR